MSLLPKRLTGEARAPAAEEDLPRMGFFDHLEELRRRIFVCLIAVFVLFFVAWAWAAEIFEFLAAPVRKVLPPGQNLSYTTLTEPFLMYFRVALLAAVIAASPIILWQVWLFIAPALYRKEKKYVFPFITAGVFFFLSGCAFGYYEAFPVVVRFLVGVGKNFNAVITINEYLSTATKIIMGLGLCFEMPILIFFLARMGLVSERFLLAKFKYAVLVIFIIAAIVTPTPDIATQCVFALPMIALYLLGIAIAWVFRKKEA
ncbi:MAG TPA: twin-arginine translocase subunit TatC [Thermoanaerobaculia bacterium]|nr:twin-arginine translocase subunit TatC [Thermoanaerobaculia bacterium]